MCSAIKVRSIQAIPIKRVLLIFLSGLVVRLSIYVRMSTPKAWDNVGYVG